MNRVIPDFYGAAVLTVVASLCGGVVVLCRSKALAVNGAIGSRTFVAGIHNFLVGNPRLSRQQSASASTPRPHRLALAEELAGNDDNCGG
jgi:hypothetical protein